MKKNKHGQSMIEVVVGVGVAVLLGVSLITTTLITQRTARSARNNTQASKLAQESLEKIRVMRDRNSFDQLYLSATPVASCAVIIDNNNNPDISAWTLQACNPPSGEEVRLDNNKSLFNRKLSFVLSGGTKMDITVEVSWEESTGTQKIQSKTILSKWD